MEEARLTPIIRCFRSSQSLFATEERRYRKAMDGELTGARFHKDRDASGSVNTNEQLYNCHANADCPTGNAVQIIMQAERIDFASAQQGAAEISGEGNPSVRGKSGRSSRMAGGARNRAGTRAFKRTWRSD